MGDLTRLRPLSAVSAGADLNPSDGLGNSPAGPRPSLDFALMAAVRHSECGEWQAFITAICDAIWLQHEGGHEQVSDNRMVTLLRSIAGLSYDPPTSGGEAA